MKTLIAVACVLLSAVSASAQTPVAAGSALTAAADHTGANTTGYRLYIDGAKVGADMPMSSLAAGVLTVPVPPLSGGAHTIEVSAFNPVSETKSAPLAVFAWAPPDAPGGVRVTMAGTITLSFGQPVDVVAKVEAP